MTESILIGNAPVGGEAPLLVIAGPCVLTDADSACATAAFLAEETARLGLSYVFKASFDKANRTSVTSFRGPGLARGLDMLEQVKRKVAVPVISDIHSPEQAAPAAEVLDALQVPAFLCRQTDLLVAAGRTQKPVNVKKGQFLAPWDMRHAAAKIRTTGNNRILFTERGSSFGYNNLVVDFRSLSVMRDMGVPVVFDATHSVQMPGAGDGCSGGDRRFAPILARAAVAAGVDAVFFETYPDPDQAPCDGPNSLALADIPALLENLAAIRKAAAGK
ncbi:MAG: 3-deoxy-8-phosphooctulonate synthase [Thermodesulfobacteriota bacterium]